MLKKIPLSGISNVDTKIKYHRLNLLDIMAVDATV